MTSYNYEIHQFQSPLLPFIFHPHHQVKNTVSPPHWHENIEILHCFKGCGYVICGSKKSFFSEGDLFVIDSDTSHYIASDTSVDYSCLIIGNSFGEQNGLSLPSLSFQNRIQDPLLSMQFQEVADAFAHFSSDCLLAYANIRYAVLGLLRSLCANYLLPPETRASSASNLHVKKALTYIRKNLSTRITLDALAAYVGISKYHLSHIFREFTGKTIVSAINQIRCHEAKQMIESGMSVSEAAVCCGFENLSYFSYIFKQIFQVTPSSCCANPAPD